MLLVDSLIVIGMAIADIGTIQEADGPREQSFWLRNVGTSSVTLQQGYTSCGCTTIHFDRRQVIVPGDRSRVTLRFNPRGKGGLFHEMGTIVYGAAKKRINMTLVGQCITSEETLLRQFPIRISNHLRLSANRFDLGIMHVGESKERHVTLLHQDEGNRRETLTVRFTVDQNTQKGLQHITQAVTAGGQTIHIQFDVLIK